MSFQEKRNLVNITSTLLISGVYFWYVFRSHPQEGLNTDELLKFWAVTLLILIPVTIISKIIIHILFAITNTIATREDMPSSDERDRLIELKSTRVSHYTFSLGFILAMVALALNMSVSVMFMVLITSGIIAEIAENLLQIHYYRKGI